MHAQMLVLETNSLESLYGKNTIMKMMWQWASALYILFFCYAHA